MSTSPLEIRIASRAELEMMVDWARAENWNPGDFDADCFYAADPQGFWVGCLEGKAIACLSAVKYGDDFGFIGFYIVKPEFRGQGFGWHIWQTVLATVQDRNLALDGVVAQQGNYQKSGFRIAYRNVRYEGRGGGDLPQHAGLVALTEIPFEQVAAYDAAFFPGDRVRFLQQWVRQPQSTALGIMQDGQLVGYGMVRPSQFGFRIGPFFADSEALAEPLFVALQSCIPATASFYLDVPQINPMAIRLAERHGMTPGFETARMYTQQIPDLPSDRWYGVTTLEVG